MSHIHTREVQGKGYYAATYCAIAYVLCNCIVLLRTVQLHLPFVLLPGRYCTALCGKHQHFAKVWLVAQPPALLHTILCIICYAICPTFTRFNYSRSWL